MPLPVDYGTGIVTGTFTDTAGDPVVGTVSFTPSASRLLGTGAVILGDPIVVDLDADGSLTVTLPASNDPNVNPTDFTYRVDETFVGAVGSTYFIDVLEGTTLDLSDVVVPGTENSGTVILAGTTLASLTDVDTTTTPPADLDSLMFNNTSGKWEPGVPAGTGGTFAVVDAVVAADAVDGTGDQFTFIGYDRGGAGGGIVPASWVGVEGFIDVDAATLAGGITALYGGSATFLVYTGSVWSVRTVTDATVTDPWPAVTAYNIVGSVAGILDSGVFHAADADSIAATGSGLDAGFFKVGEILRNHEGTLDRWFFMSAVGTTNKNVAALGAASWEYGALNFTDGNGDPTTHCHVWLKNQTDPAETGMYSVAAGTFVATKFVHPDVFDPPGMGYRVTLLYPGDTSNGTTWIWMADDPAIHFRANRVDDPGLVGDWVLWIDPAGGGGSVATDAIWDAAGDLAYGTGSNTATRLPLGTTGHVLKAGASAPAWGTLAKADVGLGNVTDDAQVKASTATTKGDLWVATASATPARLGVGADGTAPHADTNSTTGILWARAARTHLYVTGSYTPLAPSSSAVGQTNSRIFYLPFYVPKRTAFDRIAINHTATTSTTGGVRLGIYATATAGGVPGSLILDAGVADTTTAAAVKEITISQTLDPGIYWAAAGFQFTGSTPSVTSAASCQIQLALSAPGATSGVYYYESAVSGALNSTATVSSATTQPPLVWLRSA